MSAKLRWLKRAVKHLDDIYEYLEPKNERAAVKLYNEILDTADVLMQFPLAGKMEPVLEDNPKCYRSIVASKHYKLIYRVDKDIVKIVAVWDCRQDTVRLKKML